MSMPMSESAPMPQMSTGLGDEFGGGMGMELSPLAKWRIEQQEKLTAKAAAASEALQGRLADASTALQEFYDQRAEKISKRASTNRASEASYIEERDASLMSDSWASVATLVDLKDKSGDSKDPYAKDNSRMRGLLFKLK